MPKTPEFNLDPPTDDEIALGSAVPLPQAVGIANAAGSNVTIDPEDFKPFDLKGTP